jgi:enoyl-CoA hydratase/carnithine racemase
MTEPEVLVTVTDRTMVITLNRPEKLNAFNQGLWSELSAALVAYRDDPQLGAAIVTGSGRAFSAGVDLAQGKPAAEQRVALPDISPAPNPLAELASLEKPVIMAVNGLAFAGGMYLALSGHLILAAMSAEFELTEIRRGVDATGWSIGADYGLSRAMAFEIALGGRLSAQRAHQIGLINRVVPDHELMAQAVALAAYLAELPPLVVRANLNLVQSLIPAVPPLVQEDAERYRAIVMDSADAREGISAFREKRQPVFRGC